MLLLADNFYNEAILNEYLPQKCHNVLSNYCQVFPTKSCGYLNSAMRKLPIGSRISSCSSSESSQTGNYFHI